MRRIHDVSAVRGDDSSKAKNARMLLSPSHRSPLNFTLLSVTLSSCFHLQAPNFPLREFERALCGDVNAVVRCLLGQSWRLRSLVLWYRIQVTMLKLYLRWFLLRNDILMSKSWHFMTIAMKDLFRTNSFRWRATWPWCKSAASAKWFPHALPSNGDKNLPSFKIMTMTSRALYFSFPP